MSLWYSDPGLVTFALSRVTGSVLNAGQTTCVRVCLLSFPWSLILCYTHTQCGSHYPPVRVCRERERERDCVMISSLQKAAAAHLVPPPAVYTTFYVCVPIICDMCRISWFTDKVHSIYENTVHLIVAEVTVVFIEF